MHMFLMLQQSLQHLHIKNLGHCNLWYASGVSPEFNYLDAHATLFRCIQRSICLPMIQCAISRGRRGRYWETRRAVKIYVSQALSQLLVYIAYSNPTH